MFSNHDAIRTSREAMRAKCESLQFDRRQVLSELSRLDKKNPSAARSWLVDTAWDLKRRVRSIITSYQAVHNLSAQGIERDSLVTLGKTLVSLELETNKLLSLGGKQSIGLARTTEPLCQRIAELTLLLKKALYALEGEPSSVH